MKADTKELLTRLAETFPPHRLEPVLFDEGKGIWGTYSRRDTFEAGSEGLSWPELTDEFVEAHYGALYWISPEGFVAVLPAYLAILLRDVSENPMPEIVLVQLTPKHDSEAEFNARLALLSEQQRLLIAEILGALASNLRWAFYCDDRFRAAATSWSSLASEARPWKAASALGVQDSALNEGVASRRSSMQSRADMRGLEGLEYLLIQGFQTKELLALLAEAFPPQRLGRALFDEGRGQWDTYIYRDGIEASSEGLSWLELDDGFAAFCGALRWMRPEAFVAALPAYLATLIRGHGDNELPDAVESQLTPMHSSEAKFNARLALFNRKQRLVIADIFEALANRVCWSHYSDGFREVATSWFSLASEAPPSEAARVVDDRAPALDKHRRIVARHGAILNRRVRTGWPRLGTDERIQLKELLTRLAETFPPRRLEPVLFDEGRGTWETYIFRDNFEAVSEGFSWPELGDEFVETHYGALYWMRPEGFVAILPAYLVTLIRGISDNALPSRVILHLTREHYSDNAFDARLALFTRQQRQVVAEVLEALASCERWYRYSDRFRRVATSWFSFASEAPQ